MTDHPLEDVVIYAFGPFASAAFPRGDDPGPRLQYGGTPIELHYDAPGANVTKVNVGGIPCIIVSDGNDRYGGSDKPPSIAISCDWSPR